MSQIAQEFNEVLRNMDSPKVPQQIYIIILVWQMRNLDYSILASLRVVSELLCKMHQVHIGVIYAL